MYLLMREWCLQMYMRFVLGIVIGHVGLCPIVWSFLLKCSVRCAISMTQHADCKTSITVQPKQNVHRMGEGDAVAI